MSIVPRTVFGDLVSIWSGPTSLKGAMFGPFQFAFIEMRQIFSATLIANGVVDPIIKDGSYPVSDHKFLMSP